MTKPRIGIDLDLEHDGRRWIYKLSTSYVQAIQKLGAEPVLLTPDDQRSPREIFTGIDGLLLTGGDDPHPALFGERGTRLPTRLLSYRRENFLLQIARELLQSELPCLAICLGSQMLQVAAGGTMWVDLASQWQGPLCQHSGGASHLVHPEPGSLLEQLWEQRSASLVSHHHQAVRKLAPGFQLEARAEDGVIEAWRSETHPFLLATQWHPEIQSEELGGKRVLRTFLDACQS